MALNIKNLETERLVHELADLAGETQAKAVAIAAQERLDRLRSSHRRERLAARVAVLQQAVRDAGSPLSTDSLYDENGLPA